MSFEIGYETEKAVLRWGFEINWICIKKGGYLDGRELSFCPFIFSVW